MNHFQHRRSVWALPALFAILAIFGLIVACGGDSASPAATSAATAPKQSSEPFTIQLLGPFSGAVAFYGETYKQGMQLAFDQLGPIKGRPLKIETFDDGCAPEASVNAVNQIIDKAQVIFGPGCSGGALAVVKTLDKAGIPSCSPVFAESLVQQGSTHVFQATVTTRGQASAILQKMKRSGVKTVGVILDDSGFSQSAGPVIKEEADKAGIKIVNTYTYKGKDTNFEGLLLNAKKDSPDALFHFAYEIEAGLIVKQAKQLGVSIPIYGGSAFVNPEFVKAGGDATEGKIFATVLLPDDPTPAVKKFVDAFRAKYNSDPTDTATLAYTCGLIIGDALTKAGDNWTKQTITEAMRKVDVDTPIGKVKFDSKGAAHQPAVLGVIKGGKATFLERVN